MKKNFIRIQMLQLQLQPIHYIAGCFPLSLGPTLLEVVPPGALLVLKFDLVVVVPCPLFVLKFDLGLPTLLEVVPVAIESNVSDSDSVEVPAVDRYGAPGRLGLLYLDPGIPGRVGSSRFVGVLERITTTRCIVGRRSGSPCVHSNPI